MRPTVCERCLDEDDDVLIQSEVKVWQNGQDVWVDMVLCDGCFDVLEMHDMVREREPGAAGGQDGE